MIVLNFYGKIPTTLLSNKLKLYFCNIPKDWKSIIQDKIYEEICQQKIDIKKDIINHGYSYEIDYSLSYLQELVKRNIESHSMYDLSSIKKCVSCLVDNMICLLFDYQNEDLPFFDWKNNLFDSRLNEGDYAEKVVNFINFLYFNMPNKPHLDYIYSSNSNPLEKSIILLNLSFKPSIGFKAPLSTKEIIDHIKILGKQLDQFLGIENDYYKLDYIINALYKDNEYNNYHYLKTFTLLEMLLLDSKLKTADIDNLLVPFLSSKYKKNAYPVATLLRQMRNKIGHGDFKGFNKKIEIFAEQFMTAFNFDYSEYSRSNWILLYLCSLIDDILRDSILQKLETN